MPSANASTVPDPILVEGCWPGPLQVLLLHSAIDPHERALEAWREWNRRVDLEREHVDVGSFRLFPLVYRRLLHAEPSAPHAKRLQGLYKRAWYENQFRLRAASVALQALARAGLDAMVLKGVAIAQTYYRDVGSRPMADIDILVRPGSIARAIAALAKAGWHVPPDGPRLSDALLRYRKSIVLRRADGMELDLHWAVLDLRGDENACDSFWAAAVPVSLNRVPMRILCAADQLLHACAHGLVWNEVSPMRWIADAMMILEVAGDSMDWERLTSMAIGARVSCYLLAALEYLLDEFGAAVPDDVIARLRAAPVSLASRRLFALHTQGGFMRTPRTSVWKFLVCRRRSGLLRIPSEFLSFLRVALNIESNSDVFVHVLRESLAWANRQIRRPTRI
ncbi:MAG: nucleotidyltransferase family protein [Burkholderiaceae bacterium]|nr:nucleotidyltransferase family protein [Burkholderiaceae bacterium]